MFVIQNSEIFGSEASKLQLRISPNFTQQGYREIEKRITIFDFPIPKWGVTSKSDNKQKSFISKKNSPARLLEVYDYSVRESNVQEV